MLDRIMALISHLGDGILMISLLVFFMYKKYAVQWWVILISTLISGLFVQILKNFIFTDWLRPLHYWKFEQIHAVLGHIVYGQSFPSGHTMAATLVFTGLVLVYQQQWMQLLLACSLILVSYSRVYVGAHFPGDVLASSFIGFFLALFFHHVLVPFLLPFHEKLQQMKTFLQILAFILLTLVPVLRIFNLFPF